MLSSSIDDKGDIDQVINRFIKKLNGCIATSFDKRRINKDKDHFKHGINLWNGEPNKPVFYTKEMSSKIRELKKPVPPA